jgi:hypothetical protein
VTFPKPGTLSIKSCLRQKSLDGNRDSQKLRKLKTLGSESCYVISVETFFSG